MSDLLTKEAKSIERLKAFEPPEGYYLAFSGGKDSVVCKALMEIAGVKYDAHYRVTSVDPPELVRFIRDKHPDVEREVPRDDNGKPITMWNLIPRKLMPPTRLVRYCCSELKEDGGDGRMTVTGVRWAESNNRKKNHGPVTMMGKSSAKAIGDSPDFQPTKQGGVILINDNTESRRMIESCYKRHRTTVNPIIEWTNDDVWSFHRAHGISYCELYDCGFKRLGCVGCSMASRKTRLKEFAIWPKFYDAYLNAFAKMLEARRARGLLDSTWRMGTTPQDVMNWWLETGVLPGQYEMENL